MSQPQALRLTVHAEQLEIADDLRALLPTTKRYPGLVLSRNDVLRLAIGHGLDVLAGHAIAEQEGGEHAALP